MLNANSLSQTQSPALRILPMRDGHILFELASLDETLALHSAMEISSVTGVMELVPAARTLMVAFDPLVISRDALIDIVLDRLSSNPVQQQRMSVEIPVLYDGEDLNEVGALLGMTVEEVIRRHTESEFKVAFTGFAPGFAYLSGGDKELAVPRRQSPRTHVPAGSVAIAGEFSGVYPKASPGGWQLLGRTPISMFDLDREPASLLQPGYGVKFRQISAEEFNDIQRSLPVKADTPLEISSPCLEIKAAMLPILLQDLGRKGKAKLGVSVSGAADRASFRRANRIVGNPVGRPALEIPPTGASFMALGPSVIALSGAAAGVAIKSTCGEQLSASSDQAIALNDGDEITILPVQQGMRSYLAARGGFLGAASIDSVACDTLAEIGPLPLKAGDGVGIQQAASSFIVSDPYLAPKTLPKAGDTVTLDVTMGPRTDWFTPEAVEAFLSQGWLVTPQTSRVGVRLQGTPLARSVSRELPSEATLHGAIQVPASGQPVLFLVDHPLTGGYPVIANVAEHHLDLAAQIPPGAFIRFRAVDDFREIPVPTRFIAEHTS